MRDPGDKQHFGDMLQGLSAAIGKGEVTKGVLQVYWMTLKDIPVEDFDAAIGKAAQGRDWFPTVSELRDLAGHKKPGVVPHYLQPADVELERVETCNYHTANGPMAVAPSYVPWCRKCKRHQALAERGGPPKELGELLATFGLSGSK